MYGLQLREQNLQLSSQLSVLASEVTAARRGTAQAEEARARCELALKQSHHQIDTLQRKLNALQIEIEQQNKLVMSRLDCIWVGLQLIYDVCLLCLFVGSWWKRKWI